MEVSLNIHNPFWETVYKIQSNSPFVKGRHGVYHEIVHAASQISQRFGCYAWGTADCLHYIGSFSQDYKRRSFKSNLHGRIHNYLQNHRSKENGRKNTNLMVFENIRETLLLQDIHLYLFTFDVLKIGEETVDYAGFSQDGELVRAVEQLLICSYRRKQQCTWNRG
jgi:hypothetical protein